MIEADPKVKPQHIPRVFLLVTMDPWVIPVAVTDFMPPPAIAPPNANAPRVSPLTFRFLRDILSKELGEREATVSTTAAPKDPTADAAKAFMVPPRAAQPNGAAAAAVRPNPRTAGARPPVRLFSHFHPDDSHDLPLGSLRLIGSFA